jgi:hypothetical protein
MDEKARLFRFYLVLLAIFTVGRWGLSLGHADYDKTNQVFSLVILTNLSAAYFGLMTRIFLNGSWKDAMMAGVKLAVASQIVIFLSTAISYALGLQTFFNYARALNVEAPIGMGEAMVRRLVTFVVNCILNGIIGAIGYGIAGVAKPAR